MLAASPTRLKVQTKFPDDSSEGLAERLSQQVSQFGLIRHGGDCIRARLRFAELLVVAEVADYLDVATPSQLAQSHPVDPDSRCSYPTIGPTTPRSEKS